MHLIKSLACCVVLVAAILLLLAPSASAYDSACYVSPSGARGEPSRFWQGSECPSGPGYLENRWIGVGDEHRRIFYRAGDAIGFPYRYSRTGRLRVFTGDEHYTALVSATRINFTNFRPALYPAITFTVRERVFQPAELAQLPDFSLAFWDWASGNQGCPFDIPEILCHSFVGGIGALNSNHFPPQSQQWYLRLHDAALLQARRCGRMAGNSAFATGQFQEFYDACVVAAVSTEAVAQHFLQDSLSSGHMWERWGSSNWNDFPTEGRTLAASLVGLTSGIIHGIDAVTEQHGVVASRLILGEDDLSRTEDQLCFPGSSSQYRALPATSLLTAPPTRGFGDLSLDRAIDDPNYRASLAPHLSRLDSCAATSLHEVASAAGVSTALPVALRVGDIVRDCFQMRAMNAAMFAALNIDYITNRGEPATLDFSSRIVPRLVPVVDEEAGFDLTPEFVRNLSRRLRDDLLAVYDRARERSRDDPSGTDLARGGLPPLLGVQPNGFYIDHDPGAPMVTVPTRTPPTLDPAFPWPAGATRLDIGGQPDRSWMLALTFHRAQAVELCRGDYTPRSVLDGYRARVAATVLPVIETDAHRSACEACAEFVFRHLGGAQGDSFQPLCQAAASLFPEVLGSPGSSRYPVIIPGAEVSGATDPHERARRWCGCASSSEHACESELGVGFACVDSSSNRARRQRCVGVCRPFDCSDEERGRKIGERYAMSPGSPARVPYDNGGGVTAHDWSGIVLQDFTESLTCPVNRDRTSALIATDDRMTAHWVEGVIWKAYQCLSGRPGHELSGPSALASPSTPCTPSQHCPATGASMNEVRQDFRGGFLWWGRRDCPRGGYCLHLHLRISAPEGRWLSPAELRERVDFNALSTCVGVDVVPNPPGSAGNAHACSPGDGRCSDNAVQLVCGDLDGDGFRDWIPNACALGTNCVASLGRCASMPGVDGGSDAGAPSEAGSADADVPSSEIPSGDSGMDGGVARDSDAPASSCMGPTAQNCGRCGSQTRTCTGGVWSAWSACSGEGVCAPGTRESCMGSGARTCSSSCVWSSCSGYCGDGTCSNGENCATCPAPECACSMGVCDSSIGTCVACGGVGQACCSGTPCGGSTSAICLAGTCRHCGLSSEPCCGSGAPCGASLTCSATSSTCQPCSAGPLWWTDFEGVSFPGATGPRRLPYPVDAELLDSGGLLATELGTGSPGQALVWYGGGSYQMHSSAAIVLPAAVDSARTVRLAFDAFLSPEVPGDIYLYAQRGACGPASRISPVLRRLSGWQSYSIDLPMCSAGTGIVLYVGEVYESPRTLQALRLDNVRLTYPDAAPWCSCAVGTTRSCYAGPSGTAGIGSCRHGSQTCSGTVWGACTGQVVPATETCDGADNDCDGATDEGLSESCYGGPSGTRGVGRCVAGTRICSMGAWGACVGQVVPATETCDGTDNDCDNATDEGGADVSCAARANSSATCTMAACRYTCAVGYGDCDGNATNGCETDTRVSATHCGMCGHPCASGERCSGSMCGVACAGSTPTNCGGTCVDTTANAAHCGACRNACPTRANAAATCSASTCGFTCSAGFGNCDGSTANGCERDLRADNANCGTCGNTCTGSRTCQASSCACPAGRTPCSGTCVDTTADATNCGGCGTTCALPNATPTCTSSTCHVASCAANFADCDGNPANGCEIDTRSSTSHCGVCGRACATGQVCSSGRCTISCGGSTPTPCGGVCVNTASDLANCGGCGVSCPTRANAARACTSSSCGFTCNTGFGDCDGNATNGCERDLRSDAANCGGCGISCTGGQVCQGSSCVCPVGQVVCDGRCVSTTSDAANCGGCGNACAAPSGGTTSCVASSCIPACPTGQANCAGTCRLVGASCSVGTGACARSGVVVCSGTTTGCSVSAGSPSAEACDNIDNNCNGATDEGLSLSCYTGPIGTRDQGRCRAGAQTCAVGAWGVCSGEVLPATETCNGVDDDCDGATDEVCACTPGISRSCYSGPSGTAGVGVCRRGTQSCVTGGVWGVCVDEIGPSVENCDNADNDCNGRIDDVTRPCYAGPSGTAGIGACRSGSQSCSAGAWGACLGEVRPTTEVCDNIDNNCDSRTDEGLTRSCYVGPVGTSGRGACRAGVESCSSGAWGSCLGQVTPVTETCNGIDDDCDGATDEEFVGQGSTCSVSGLSGACGAGRLACRAGGTVCEQTIWPSSEVCDNADNDCDGNIDQVCIRFSFSPSGYGPSCSIWRRDTDAPNGAHWYGYTALSGVQTHLWPYTANGAVIRINFACYSPPMSPDGADLDLPLTPGGPPASAAESAWAFGATACGGGGAIMVAPYGAPMVTFGGGSPASIPALGTRGAIPALSCVTAIDPRNATCNNPACWDCGIGVACCVSTAVCEWNCKNGIDDDGDGLTDCADPSCSHAVAHVGDPRAFMEGGVLRCPW